MTRYLLIVGLCSLIFSCDGRDSTSGTAALSGDELKDKPARDGDDDSTLIPVPGGQDVPGIPED